MDDNKIIDMFWERCEAAISQAQQKYGGLCRQLAWHILPDSRDVEECISDVMMKLWNSIPPERPRSLKAYLLRITRNQALDRAMYNNAEMRKSALTESFEEMDTFLADSRTGTQRQLESWELREFLNRFLQELKQENRIIFVRRYWYGESIREIAQALHASEGKVRSSLYHTRNRLRERMLQEGVSL